MSGGVCNEGHSARIVELEFALECEISDACRAERQRDTLIRNILAMIGEEPERDDGCDSGAELSESETGRALRALLHLGVDREAGRSAALELAAIKAGKWAGTWASGYGRARYRFDSSKELQRDAARIQRDGISWSTATGARGTSDSEESARAAADADLRLAGWWLEPVARADLAPRRNVIPGLPRL